MCELIAGAELCVTYNGTGFDTLVLEKYTDHASNRQMRMKHLDLFQKVRDVTGAWMKLDTLLVLNGQDPKTADGLEAIKMWKTGNRVDLAHYCEKDVELLARLALQRELQIGGGLTLKNDCFGIASALTARRYGEQLSNESLSI